MNKLEWIGASVAIILVALIGIGYNITDQTYYCSEKGLVMECARFSSSELRCYPSLTTTAGYRDCKEGWIKVEGEIQLEPEITSNKLVKKYICNQKECEEIV